MATEGLLQELRPHAVWDLIRWLWERRETVLPVVIVVIIAGYQWLRSQPVDFWLLIIVCVGSVLMLLYYGERKSQKRKDPLGFEIPPSPPPVPVVLPPPWGEPEEQWPALQVGGVLNAIEGFQAQVLKPPVRVFATAKGRTVAEVLVQAFRLSGWTVQHDLASASYVAPLSAEEGTVVRIRYRKQVARIGMAGFSVVLGVRGIIPGIGNVSEEHFPDSDEYDFIQVEVGVRTN